MMMCFLAMAQPCQFHTHNLSLLPLILVHFLLMIFYVFFLLTRILSPYFNYVQLIVLQLPLLQHIFQVRNLQTRTLRLESKPKGGTYEWPHHNLAFLPSLSFSYVVKTFLSDWHSRLRHPALSILQKNYFIISFTYFVKCFNGTIMHFLFY